MPQHNRPTWQDEDTRLFTQYGDAFVPRRREQTAVISGLLDELPSPNAIELGCGQGLLAERLLDDHLRLSLVALDGSPDMIAVARTRLDRHGARAVIVEGELEDRSWTTLGVGAVVSSLAIHHLDDEGKQRLYRTVWETLAPGGVFVHADIFEPTSPAGLRANGRRWDALVQEQSAAVFGGPEAYDAFRDSHWNSFWFPDLVDALAPVASHLRWLETAGFIDVDVVWALAGHAILAAYRPGGDGR